jgi:hypothetical protein
VTIISRLLVHAWGTSTPVWRRPPSDFLRYPMIDESSSDLYLSDPDLSPSFTCDLPRNDAKRSYITTLKVCGNKKKLSTVICGESHHQWPPKCQRMRYGGCSGNWLPHSFVALCKAIRISPMPRGGMWGDVYIHAFSPSSTLLVWVTQRSWHCGRGGRKVGWITIQSFS